MKNSCRSVPSRLHAKIARTFPRLPAGAAISLFLGDLFLRCAGRCAPPPAIPATVRIPDQTALRVPCAIAAPAPDSALRWKSRSATLPAAPPLDNRSGSIPDHPPRCTEFRRPRTDEKLRGSLAATRYPPPPETRRTNPPPQKS